MLLGKATASVKSARMKNNSFVIGNFSNLG